MRILIVQPSYSQPDDVFFFIKNCTAFRRVAADVKRQASLISYTTVTNYVKKLEASRLLFIARSVGRTVFSPAAV
jgi:predicted AAA+ superfamily ATPase